jgi:hypothetical protein
MAAFQQNQRKDRRTGLVDSYLAKHIQADVRISGYGDVLETLTSWGRSLSLPHTKGVKPLTDRGSPSNPKLF